MLLRRFIATLLFLSCTGLIMAQAVLATDITTPAGAAPVPPTVYSRIRGLFDIDLPQFDPPGTFRLHFNPHFGDLLHRYYLTASTGVEWAYTDNLEFHVDSDAYIKHGFRSGPSISGIGELHLGGKYLFPNWLRPDYEATAGLNVDLPTGNPPKEFNDGHYHIDPFVIVQQQSTENRHLTTFYGSTLDFITPARTGGNFGHNAPHHHNIAFNTGAVYDMGQLKWTLQGTYQTTAIIGGAHPDHFFIVRPSLLWYVPKKYTFKSKIQWIVGFGAQSVWGPEGHDFSTGSRLRADITFTQALSRLRDAFDYRR